MPVFNNRRLWLWVPAFAGTTAKHPPSHEQEIARVKVRHQHVLQHDAVVGVVGDDHRPSLENLKILNFKPGGVFFVPEAAAPLNADDIWGEKGKNQKPNIGNKI